MINGNLKTICIAMAVLMIACVIVPVQAGTRGRLLIHVKDSKGEPLPDVKIHLVSEKSSARFYDLETNKKGRATLSGIEPDLYSAKVSKEGYLEFNAKVKARVGVKTKVDWELLTVEEAKAKMIAEKRASMSPEELAQYDAKDAHNAGMTAYQAGNMDEAKAQFEKAIKLWPEVSYIDYLLLGQFAGQAHDVDQAIKYLEKARELDTKEEAKLDILRLLGASYMIKNNYAKVKETWGEVVAEKPDKDLLFNLANIGIKEKNYDYAIKNLEVCTRDFPDYGDAQMLLGDLYIQTKQNDKALAAYEKYLEILKKTDNVSPETMKNAKDTVKVLKEMQKKK